MGSAKAGTAPTARNDNVNGTDSLLTTPRQREVVNNESISDNIMNERMFDNLKAVEEIQLKTKGMGRKAEVLGWVADQYAIRADLLAHRWGRGGQVTGERVRQVVATWRSDGLVRTGRLLGDQPQWIWPTAKGMAAGGRSWRAARPAYHLLTHIDAVAAVRLGLEQRCALSRWDCERTLYQDAVPGAHVADGVAWFGDDPWAVEVDLTQKSRRRLEAILAELLGRWPGVVYVCSTDTIRAAVADVAAGDAAVQLTPLRDLDPRCAP